MSYQVLARKYRPRSFQELVGQEHVARALMNALDQQRLHHAYLFTGTRGVGKTTIARILSKCLNCETGVSSAPCGVCGTCREIDEGRFVDLIEVDAASRTKVEDTRELLDNVQYAPTRGRYKVYLIDEVHMLSGHSFNALLKTLEEPPPHVKFLLATTDPQKLPITILSRCLQFSLKAMSPERVVEHLQHVLDQETVSYDLPALWELGRAANGSMRDALSLTDQAIAFGNGRLSEADVRTMLGAIDRDLVFRVIEAVHSGDAAQVLAVVAALAEQSVDFAGALKELVATLHRLAVAQQLPEAIDNSLGDQERVLALAAQLTAEDVQLYYQITLHGRRDLPYAADTRSGFEMTLLRMLSFRPLPDSAGDQGASGQGATGAGTRPAPAPRAPGSGPVARQAAAPVMTTAVAQQTVASAQPAAAAMVNRAPEPTPPLPENVVPLRRPVAEAPAPARATPVPVAASPVTVPAPAEPPKPAPTAPVTPDAIAAARAGRFDWHALLATGGLSGMTLNLARHTCLLPEGDDRLALELSPGQEVLADQRHVAAINQWLNELLGRPVKLNLVLREPHQETPLLRDQRLRAERQRAAEQAIHGDPNVQALLRDAGAQLVNDSIRPID